MDSVPLNAWRPCSRRQYFGSDRPACAVRTPMRTRSWRRRPRGPDFPARGEGRHHLCRSPSPSRCAGGGDIVRRRDHRALRHDSAVAMAVPRTAVTKRSPATRRSQPPARPIEKVQGGFEVWHCLCSGRARSTARARAEDLSWRREAPRGGVAVKGGFRPRLRWVAMSIATQLLAVARSRGRNHVAFRIRYGLESANRAAILFPLRLKVSDTSLPSQASPRYFRSSVRSRASG